MLMEAKLEMPDTSGTPEEVTARYVSRAEVDDAMVMVEEEANVMEYATVLAGNCIVPVGEYEEKLKVVSLVSDVDAADGKAPVIAAPEMTREVRVTPIVCHVDEVLGSEPPVQATPV